MKTISVCVPTYNRPETLKQLIHTFLKQDYINKELIISDDSTNDDVKDLVLSFKNKKIKYFQNHPSLKFATNLITCLERATGDYLFIMGDDDIFWANNVLTKYVNVFDKNPSVGFVYSNQIQFSETLKVEYIIQHFPKNQLYTKGIEAMNSIWTRSIFIGGIGLRNTFDLKSMYPKKNILHPQVYLLGNIINRSDAYGLAENCVGVRSHDDQIIFHALKNKKVREDGEHVNIELIKLFKELKKKYSLSMDSNLISHQLISQYYVMVFKEKSILGNKLMEQNYKRFCALSLSARRSNKLRTIVFIAKILPAWSIRYLRKSALMIVKFSNAGEFNAYQKKLNKIVNL